ncbi:glycosyltransferase family 4 protein [Janthinobacterium sp. 1_2014MBL_MicDiv]|uniref:glycosyltransferase family 4 protein n=1 Tax=Janthinobacterium sp. 1_2014MBL_MicDiv TaxID=1644131 RepID=UPI0008F4F137|nr:glycosyltransferase family 4 protein [Janthinobacterium sp. 1_2014MBL_MicDiv]APA67026.1 glycosyl transferase family 1 [Janthinobacterium sp. 1_2014MBL_MicDiv]
MRVLLLSFYYTPDLCPGSFRAASLADALLATLPAGSHVDVITTMPNRYSKFSAVAPEVEEHAGLTIRRIGLPAHQSGMLDQSKAFLAFARSAIKLAKSAEYDLVCATSSRLMTAVLGAWIARNRCAALYLDIRDIFVDTIKDVLPKRLAGIAKPVFSLLEKWTIRRADKVNLISAGFADYFSSRYPDQKFSYFTNGIDDEFLYIGMGDRAVSTPVAPLISIVYAGNVGEGQGLHLILPALARRLRGRARFTVIGDGGRRAALESALSEAGSDNVSFLPPMKRQELIAAYQAADVLFVHLNDYDAFKKVLPSKLFEYGASGKPVLAGVDGYAAKFVAEEIPNAAVFYPCDADAAVAAFDRLVIQDTRREQFVAKFSRMNIAREMAGDIIASCRQP